jgi:hypothetical protein
MFGPHDNDPTGVRIVRTSPSSMNTKAFPFCLLAASALVLSSAPRAQEDQIFWTDGTVIENVTVTSFTLREIKYRTKSGATETQSSDKVADLRVAKVLDRYRRAYADAKKAEGPGNFLAEAERLKSDPFLAQFGFVEAARLLIDNGQYSDAFQVLETLATEHPDSGFLPRLYREKLDFYIGRGKEKGAEALAVADKYSSAAQTQAYPAGYVVEARYYKTMARGISGELDSAQLRTEMKQVLQDAATGHPGVAQRARLQVANTLLMEGKIDEAKQEFEDLLKKDYSPEDVRAGAWLGLGNCHFKSGDPVNKEPYYQALLAFLRVYIETPKAAPAIVGEALHMGSQAAEKWGGADSARIRGKLRHILNRDFPDNPWR